MRLPRTKLLYAAERVTPVALSGELGNYLLSLRTCSAFIPGSVEFARAFLQQYYFPSADAVFDHSKLAECHCLELGLVSFVILVLELCSQLSPQLRDRIARRRSVSSFL